MASKVSVGKTAPVPLGQQRAANSLPVVFAEDQSPIPVEEQNKIQSEVALSLLGIPRAEVALGIFADVNTYDVNPTEWAQFPLENKTSTSDDEEVVDGVVHVPAEAGARLIASDGNTTILTSKRFFRYQPGRVSASTMGVKMNVTADPHLTETPNRDTMKGAPSIKKWGVFDKFDGYYFEVVNAGQKNDFRCVRRTHAVIPSQPSGYANDIAWFNSAQENGAFSPSTSFGVAGVDPVIIRDGLVYTAAALYDPSLCYSPAYVRAIDASSDPYGALKDYSFDSGFSLRLATYNGSVWSEVMTDRQFQFPFDQSTAIGKLDTAEDFINYIRMDGHCNFYAALANLNRKGATAPTAPTDLGGLAATNLYGPTLLTSNDDHDGILAAHGWDTDPSTSNRNSKVWHLLVNTLGSTGGGGKRVVNTDITSSTRVPNRAEGSEVSDGNITLKEWFNICVPEPYRLVYEWRPCRAMFSGDKLDGQESIVRWSDVNTSAEDTISGPDNGVINLPGDIIKTPDLEDLTTNSAYEVDFTKVTMWKTEYSWYGAVGATFLCYVPVGNNEARWVRVHHIRASNQHSVASLGNAFLPITYLSHGGKSSGLDPAQGGVDIGNTLVKYGASYYIDGGDKGTVKLLSKSSDYQRTVSKATYTLSGGSYSVSGSDATYAVASHTSIPADLAVGLIGAYIEGDATNKIKWVSEPSAGNVTLHFSAALPVATNPLNLVIPRAQKSLLTLRAKDFISNRDGRAVRNRLQIYPIKYGAGVIGGGDDDILSIKSYKNPLVIVSNISGTAGSAVASVGTVKNPSNANNYVNTKKSILPVQVSFTGTAPAIPDGDYRYGYFLGTTDGGIANDVNPPTSSFSPILGRLENKGGLYYFSKYSSYPQDTYIAGKFLLERNLILNTSASTIFSEKSLSAGDGLVGSAGSSDQTKWDRLQADGLATFEDITRLSGVRVAQDLALTPVPGTGNEIFSFYVSNGGYQFDLQDFFSYNKEYLSFPLTDEVDIISVFGLYDLSTTSSTIKISSSLSWEEQ